MQVRRKVLAMAAAFALFAAQSALAGEDVTTAPATLGQSAPTQDQGLVRSIMKKANVATDDVGEPKDFVLKSRPAAPTDYVPVFRKPEEHKARVLTPEQIKAAQAELDAAGARDAKLRDAFPPARRAYLEAERQKAAKAAAKKSSAPIATQTQ